MPLDDLCEMERGELILAAAEARTLLEAARDALRHYANEDHWDDVTPPESVNTAGYSIWEYEGGHDLPWSVARSALDASASTEGESRNTQTHSKLSETSE